MDIIGVVFRPVVALAIGASLVLAGCGISTSQSELDKAKAAGASEEAARQSAAAQQEAQAKLAAEVQKLKEQLAARPGATVTPSPPDVQQTAQPAEPAGTSCGGNVSAGPNTTCPFALRVALDYLNQGGGNRTIEVLSPVTGKFYTMKCESGVPSVCRGGNNAVVYIR